MRSVTQTHVLQFGAEVSFGSIAGPFDTVDAYADSSASPTATIEWRLYATVAGIASLIAKGSTIGGTPEIVSWTPAEINPVYANGTTYELRAYWSEQGIPPVVKASLVGYNQTDATADSSNSSNQAVPDGFGEITFATLNGYAQFADASVVQTNVGSGITFLLYALAEAGGVEALVASQDLTQNDGTAPVFAHVPLPGAVQYRLAARAKSSRSFGLQIDASLAVYSSSVVTKPTPSSWTQAAWFIDPANSTGNASDANDGATAATPVKSWNGGVVAKWGTDSPTLRQDTTVTWLSSQPLGGADPVIVSAIMTGTVLVLKADLPVPVHAGVAGAVTPKNRATGQLLEVDLGFAATVGQLVRNTTAAKDSFAWVYSLVAGTTFLLSQPLAPYPVPSPEVPATTEVDTWAVGDTFEIYNLIEINLTHAQGNPAAFNAPASFPAPVQFQHLHFASPDGVDSDNNVTFANVAVVECSTNCVWDDAPDFASDYINTACNCALPSSVTSRNDQWFMFGGFIISQFVGCLAPWSFGYDTILDNLSGSGFVVGGPMGQGNGIPGFQQVYIAGQLNIQNMLSCAQSVGPTSKVWGPGSLNAIGSSVLYFAPANTAVATFLNAGGLFLNGSNSVSTYNSGTGAWTGGIALTPAHLDDPAFLNGLALNVGGASIRKFAGSF